MEKNIKYFYHHLINIDLSASYYHHLSDGTLEGKALLREILILNGLIRYLMKKEKKLKINISCRTCY